MTNRKTLLSKVLAPILISGSVLVGNGFTSPNVAEAQDVSLSLWRNGHGVGYRVHGHGNSRHIDFNFFNPGINSRISIPIDSSFKTPYSFVWHHKVPEAFICGGYVDQSRFDRVKNGRMEYDELIRINLPVYSVNEPIIPMFLSSNQWLVTPQLKDRKGDMVEFRLFDMNKRELVEPVERMRIPQTNSCIYLVKPWVLPKGNYQTEFFLNGKRNKSIGFRVE